MKSSNEQQNNVIINSESTEQIDELKKANEALEAEVNTLRNRVLNLEQERDELKEDYDELKNFCEEFERIAEEQRRSEEEWNPLEADYAQLVRDHAELGREFYNQINPPPSYSEEETQPQIQIPPK